MMIGVLSERGGNENRVCLTPEGAATLSRAGHKVIVESGAGVPARFSDEEYLAAGARIAFARAEVLGRGDLLMKVSALRGDDLAHLHEGQTVMAFHHLAATTPAQLNRLLETGTTLIGYEVIEDSQGDLPVLHAMSELAGQISVHVGAHYPETQSGGRGILLGGATGIPPAHVVILGAGVVGLWAARTAAGNRAQVSILDRRARALRYAEEVLGRRVVTEVAHQQTMARAVADADVLIGAILIRGARAPRAVTREMIAGMKPGSVFVDVSIDQGGCSETSRPTTLDDPVFVEKGVTHYCVPNMTSAVGRTASVALSTSVLPLVEELAEMGVEAALQANLGLAAGVYVHRGVLVSEAVGRAFGMGSQRLPGLVGVESQPGWLS
jgi:alanine dehydrogenase